MDIAAVLSPFFYALWAVALFVTCLGVFFGSAWFKGKLGEFIVRRRLEKLDTTTYQLFHDLTLPTEDGGTTQIDHVVLSPYGIFVIETKHMKGWIFGNPKQKQWTQKIYKHTSRFQNPLHQNHKHLMTLAALLNIPTDRLFSIVVFTGDAEFKTEMPDNVTTPGGCNSYIQAKTTCCFSLEGVQKIAKILESNALEKGWETNRQHVAHVKELIAEKEACVQCPRCGAEMVKRTAKKGKDAGNSFWGCSTFPRCRGIKSL